MVSWLAITWARFFKGESEGGSRFMASSGGGGLGSVPLPPPSGPSPSPVPTCSNLTGTEACCTTTRFVHTITRRIATTTPKKTKSASNMLATRS